MPVSSVTSKGQVTIPKQVRDALHLRRGDKVDFRLEEDGSVRLYPIARKVDEVFGVFSHKAGPVAPSVEQMDRGIAEAVARRGR